MPNNNSSGSKSSSNSNNSSSNNNENDNILRMNSRQMEIICTTPCKSLKQDYGLKYCCAYSLNPRTRLNWQSAGHGGSLSLGPWGLPI